MTWRSTTFRFAALVFLCQIVAAAVLLAAVGAVLRGRSDQAAAATAETIRANLLASYARGGAPALAREIEARQTAGVTRNGVMLLVDGAGRALAGNLGGWPPSVPATSGYIEVQLYRIGHAAPETMLVRTTRLAGGEGLLTGIGVESERQLLDLLGETSALALALALIMAALAAWLAARLIVARLDGTIATLQAVRAGDLTRRVPDDRSGDAFGMLGDEVNHTLDRVTALIAELKIATDGLAHDLKSPLTRLRLALEQVMREVREPGAQEAAARALAEGERLLALVETALSISRAEGGIGRESFAETDLVELLATIAELYAPLVEDQGRAIVVAAPAHACWKVHRQLLAQAVGNLIDNAVHYGAGTITLRLTADREAVRIAVRDAGPGIAPALRGEALRRFGRLDVARGGSGAGLGLSLVQAVAHLHGGTIALDDAAPGLIVTIELR
ncbi:signal transduction histidine kinase [Sphingomonas naasensis]|uniref:histidine kinase n=1 Tax=Sphingomonas naasensis TaxID=1344951 RepID=A0A4S1WIL1_9SPHN|nr:HAMP domain-containing sensor histidine kinase [Sphingomonas naasensis]NIJ21529.1 signal transduction histidine kinase [Sphingomonas naasensis]TGX41520.1 HAMP domain-containing histidine kinase [Sphingomonas naasensis]